MFFDIAAQTEAVDAVCLVKCLPVYLMLVYFLLIIGLSLVLTYLAIDSIYVLHVLRRRMRPKITQIAMKPAPKAVQKFIDVLQSQGFEQLHLVKVEYRWRPKYLAWSLISNDHEIGVYVRRYGFQIFAEFQSIYMERDALIITRFPIGNTIETANFVSRFASKSPDNALTFQRQKIEEWDSTYGRPYLVTQDVFSREILDTYYRLYFPTDLRFLRLMTKLLLMMSVIVVVPTWVFLILIFEVSFAYIIPLLFVSLGARVFLSVANRRIFPKKDAVDFSL